RFGACGRLAEHLLGGMPLHDYHGVGSPLERLTECHGYVLRLGADVDTVTLTHWAEYVADIPDKRRVRLRYERADTGEQWIESLDDTYGIKEWERGEDYFSQILLDYLQEGVVCKGCVGDVEAELIPAQAFVSFAVEWMERELS
ncbi:MAG TPA: aminoglycoside 3-N-acetyltransferase, partial [Myxococcales bacterium]|nr:aminoglycoside 3-N-acetyltransferase [Myxococcales bacterium]